MCQLQPYHYSSLRTSRSYYSLVAVLDLLPSKKVIVNQVRRLLLPESLLGPLLSYVCP